MISSIVARAEAADIASATRTEIEALLTDLAKVTGWAEALRAKCARRLSTLAQNEPIIPERVVAGTSRTSGRDAQQVMRRSEALTLVPAMETALEQGKVSTAHIEVLSRAVTRLGENERGEFAKRSAHLAGIATVASPEEFDRTVKRLVASLEPDGGISRFEQQRRNTYLKHWTDRDTGMVCLHGELDPETGLRLIGKLDRMVERLFHTTIPDTCPTDARKHDHLNALALIALVDSGHIPTEQPDDTNATNSNVTPIRTTADGFTTPPVAEVCVVVDLDTLRHGLHEHSILDPGHGVDLPVETIRRMACDAGIIPIVLNGHGVALDVGRTKRLLHTRAFCRARRRVTGKPANRQAVRAPARTPTTSHEPTPATSERDRCGVRRAGPAAERDHRPPKHHHAAHEGGWTVTLDLGPHGTNRTLMIRLPHETLNTYKPPRARSA